MARRDKRNQLADSLRIDEPMKLMECAVDVIMGVMRAQRAALFSCLEDDVRLLVSRSLDQAALETVRALWPNTPRPLTLGSPYFGVEVGRAYMLLPCLDPDTLGLLYVEASGSMRRLRSDYLHTFSGILGRALKEWAPSDEVEQPEVSAAAGSDDAERANLEFMLERNEWNVSRVARLLGVTRMTVYNRLKRLDLPRQRVTKRRA